MIIILIPRLDLILSVVLFLLGFICVLGFYISLVDFWVYCYILALVCGVFFLVRRRESFFLLSSIFIALFMVSLTLAVAPFLFFNNDPIDLRSSIYLNSIGLIFFIATALIVSPCNAPRLFRVGSGLDQKYWLAFFKINRRIFLFSLPGVFLVITLTGGWNVFSMGLQDSGFDRVGSLVGMGPLMIFSSLNVLSGTLYLIGLWVRGRMIVSISFGLGLILLNSFTYGRGSLITLVMIILTFYGLSRGFSLRTFIALFLCGAGIVFLQIMRTLGIDNVDYGYSPLLTFLNRFSGDFDTVISTSHLIDYVKENDYLGWYHIWSTIYQFLPRFFFPDKPQFFADIYINSLIFPGVYLGREGGTTFTFGVVGVWYAVTGMATMIFGVLLQALLMGASERIFLYRSLWNKKPNISFVFYLMLISQVVIMYRVGFYPFMSAVMLILIYYVLYKSLNYY